MSSVAGWVAEANFSEARRKALNACRAYWPSRMIETEPNDIGLKRVSMFLSENLIELSAF